MAREGSEKPNRVKSTHQRDRQHMRKASELGMGRPFSMGFSEPFLATAAIGNFTGTHERTPQSVLYKSLYRAPSKN